MAATPIATIRDISTTLRVVIWAAVLRELFIILPRISVLAPLVSAMDLQ
jgi:hypothetical protein